MTFFWDRNLGVAIARAMQILHSPFTNEVYQDHFPHVARNPERGDESWLPLLGAREWFLLTQDYRIHHRKGEADALRLQRIGCFYLWGANANRWDIARCFMNAVPDIMKAAEITVRPFIYRVDRFSKLNPVALP